VILDFGFVPTVWYFLFFNILIIRERKGIEPAITKLSNFGQIHKNSSGCVVFVLITVLFFGLLPNNIYYSLDKVSTGSTTLMSPLLTKKHVQ
jgi:hypothetical protein